MEYKSFVQKWLTDEESKITTFQNVILKKTNICEIDFNILEKGIPTEAAPFLSFNENEHNNYIKILKNHGILDEIFVIGSDGSGNCVVLEVKTRNIVSFDHDNLFKRIVIAKDLITFLEYLLIFRDFIENFNSNEKNVDLYITESLSLMNSIDKSNIWKEYWEQEFGNYRDLV